MDVNKKQKESTEKWTKCSKAYFSKSNDKLYVIENEKALYPEVDDWVDFKCYGKTSPYPNFQKQYSLVYNIDIKELGDEWIDEFIWFYEFCLQYFMDDARSKSYWHAFPTCSIDGDKIRIRDHKKYLLKYKNTDEIAKAYGQPFIGDPKNDEDVSNFMIQQWIISRARIVSFILETLELLRNAHTNNHSDSQ